MSRRVIVIRAGGTGTRLWPLSTDQRPKQFIAVLGGELSLLQQTYVRARACAPDAIFVTVNIRHVDLVREQLPDVPVENIIIESVKRNTGPGIALETAVLAERFGAEDIFVASITSDDFVGNPAAFVDAFKYISNYCDLHPEYVVMPMVTPITADVGFSYVRAHFENDARVGCITEWVEKPAMSVCTEMVESGEWFAHAGLYFWKLKTAVHAFETYAPDVWARVRVAPEQVPAASIESLITIQYPFKAGYVADTWQWSDVGKWHVVKSLLPADSNANAGTSDVVRFINAKNNLVYSDGTRRIVCIGVENMVVVETDEHLLVCSAEEAARIGVVIAENKIV